MNEIELKFVGNNEDIENGENFNNIIMNNLPISYFPLNNKSLFDKLKNNNNEILSGGIDITLPITSNILTIQSSIFPYKILIKKNIKCKINLDGISYKNYNLHSDIYTFLNLNNYNIILKNNKDFDKSTSTVSSGTSISIDLLNENNIKYVKNIIINPSVININNSTGLSIEETYDNPNYKLLVYRTTTGTLILNNDIICDILLVGGGGGGGINKDSEGGGGGGGGEVCIANSFKLSTGTYNIVIGDGGSSKVLTNNLNIDGNSGGITSIKTPHNTTILSAKGGGGGGSTDNNNLGGGSGGGASGHSRYNKGGITAKQTNTSNVYYYGNNGGNGFQARGGGGGGGAGNAGLTPNTLNGGNGGNGILSTITGQNIYYGGGGGGGGGGGSGDGGKSGGIGGKGGGGNGANRNDKINGDNGKQNTGGGGGGSSIGYSGGGGSGIVIIRVNKKYVDNFIEDIDISTNNDTRIITEISNELNKKIIEFNNNEKPYNYLGIIPLVILIIIIWIFIFLFLLKFVHHYLANIYLYILLFIIIFLLIFESIWFLYTNNDIL